MKFGVKFCGAMSETDIRKAELAGGNAVGVIIRPDATYGLRSRGSHSVDIETASRLARNTPRYMQFVAVPRTSNYEEIVEIADAVGPDRLQLGETEDPDLAAELKDRYRAGPVPDLAQVIHVDEFTEPDVIDDFVPHVRFIHLDSAGPLPGGNGLVHDWEKSRAIADRARERGKFVILAGGLTPDNVAQAIATVRPDGVDVESGIRSEHDVYHQGLMSRFVANATGGA